MKTPEQRIEAGETVRFVYHEWSNREPVDRIIFETRSTGQQDLGLFVEPTIWVWKQSSESTTGEKHE